MNHLVWADGDFPSFSSSPLSMLFLCREKFTKRVLSSYISTFRDSEQWETLEGNTSAEKCTPRNNNKENWDIYLQMKRLVYTDPVNESGWNITFSRAYLTIRPGLWSRYVSGIIYKYPESRFPAAHFELWSWSRNRRGMNIHRISLSNTICSSMQSSGIDLWVHFLHHLCPAGVLSLTRLLKLQTMGYASESL